MPSSGPRSRGARNHPRPRQGVQPCLRPSAAPGLVLATQTEGGIAGRGTRLPAMEQVRLGGTGLYVSRVCLGMMSYYAGEASRPWMLDEAAAEPIVRRAVEGGITFFDTADMYSL